MDKDSILLGQILYDKKGIYRVVKETSIAVVTIDQTRKTYKTILRKNLYKYTELNPYGILITWIARMEDGKYDFVTLFINKKENVRLLCRLYYKDDTWSMYYVSDEFPEMLNGNSFDSIIDDGTPDRSTMKKIAWYPNDTIKKIRDLFYGDVLDIYLKTINSSELFDDHQTLDDYYYAMEMVNAIDGSFNILPTRMNILKIENGYVYVDKETIENIGYDIIYIGIIPWWYDVNVDNIKNSYMLIRDVITKILFVAKIVRDPTMYPHNDNVFTNSEIDKFRSIKL